MIPTTHPIPPPDGLGEDARVYLESIGLVHQTPCIRSSDIRYLDKPFRYYLERILGITPIFGSSEAFSHGGWYHVAAAKPTDVDLDEWVSEKVKIWAAGTAISATNAGMGESAYKQFVANENVRVQEAVAWFKASHTCTPYGLKGGLASLTDKDEWRILGTEMGLIRHHSLFHKTKLVVRLDRLLFHIPTSTLWIDDYKTESGSRRDRSLRCPCEYQTWHYLTVVEGCLAVLIKKFGLPENTTLGGMRHIIVGKPSIRFGMNDREYFWSSIGKKTGRTGEVALNSSDDWVVRVYEIGMPNEPIFLLGFVTENEAVGKLHELTGKTPEKVFRGEPQIRLYQKRVNDFYNGVGDYSHLSVEYSTDPPVLVSKTHISEFNDDKRYEWKLLTQKIYEMGCRNGPRPIDFPRTEAGMKSDYSPKPSVYTEFFLLPPQAWLEIMRRNLLMVSHRDRGGTHTLPTGVLE